MFIKAEESRVVKLEMNLDLLPIPIDSILLTLMIGMDMIYLKIVDGSLSGHELKKVRTQLEQIVREFP